MRSGEWAKARRLLSAAPQRLRAAIDVARRQEAHALRNEVVEGLTNQAPGGEPLRPPSPLTQAARQLAGFDGTKALLVRGDLRNTIVVTFSGDDAFIGVARSARGKDGAPLADIAKLHEFGGPPVIIPITPQMRRFLFVLLRRAGAPPTGGASLGVIVVQVPPRPFLRPALEKFRHGAGERFLARVARQLELLS